MGSGRRDSSGGRTHPRAVTEVERPHQQRHAGAHYLAGDGVLSLLRCFARVAVTARRLGVAV